MTDTQRQVVLASLPQGKLAPEHFRLEEAAIPGRPPTAKCW